MLRKEYGFLNVELRPLAEVKESILDMVEADLQDEAFSYVALELMGAGQFEESEEAVKSISCDWRAEAAELLALLAVRLNDIGKSNGIRLLFQAIALSKDPEDPLGETEVLLCIADAARRMGLRDWVRASLTECVDRVDLVLKMKDPQEVMDARILVRKIALSFKEIDLEAEALDAAQRIRDPARQSALIKELSEIGTRPNS